MRTDGPGQSALLMANARAMIDLDRESLDLPLLRRLAGRFGRAAAQAVEDLVGPP